MKRMLGIVLVAAGCGAAGAQDAGGIDWRKNLKDARAEARKTGKPLLVVFR